MTAPPNDSAATASPTPIASPVLGSAGRGSSGAGDVEAGGSDGVWAYAGAPDSTATNASVPAYREYLTR